MKKTKLAILVASAFILVGGGVAQAEDITSNREITTNDTSLHTSVGGDIVLAKDTTKSYQGAAGTREFSVTVAVTSETEGEVSHLVHAGGAKGLVEFSNLKEVNFYSYKPLTKDNTPAALTALNGGTISISNVDTVNIGKSGEIIQAPGYAQAVQTWNGSTSLTDIGTLNVFGQQGFVTQNNGGNSSLTVNADNVNINVSGSAAVSSGIYGNSKDVNYKNTITIHANNEINITNTDDRNRGTIATTDDGWLGYGSSELNITAGGNINIKNSAGAAISVSNANSADNVMGIKLSSSNGRVDIQSGGIGISNTSNFTGGSEKSVSIEAKDISVRGKTNAVVSSNGNVKIGDSNTTNIVLEGDNAINTMGSGVVELIGKSSQETTIHVKGNIVHNKLTTKTYVDDDGNGEWDKNDDNTYITRDTTFDDKSGIDLKSASLNLEKGKFAQINKLTGSDAKVIVNGFYDGTESDKTIDIKSNGVKDLAITASGDLNDAYAEKGGQALIEDLGHKVSITPAEGDQAGSTFYEGEEGSISRSWTNQGGTYKEGPENTNLEAYRNFNGMTYIQWRNENNHISQRLGDVRDAKGNIGAWARIYGYDSNYSDGINIDFKANSIQVGGDSRINQNWLIGGAFTYTDGNGKFTNGSADSDSYSLAVYASGFFDCGGYVDVVGRLGRLSTDIATQSRGGAGFTGSYDNTAFGLSTEVGYRWNLNKTFYVEPQAELAYGYVFGDDFTASEGIKVEQDNFQSLVGRLGTRLGATFNQGAGSVYLHASLNHDFLGDADSKLSRGGAPISSNVDLGGTWFSYGVGAQFNAGKSWSFYGTLERSNGSEYSEDYRYSVGARYEF